MNDGHFVPKNGQIDQDVGLRKILSTKSLKMASILSARVLSKEPSGSHFPTQKEFSSETLLIFNIKYTVLSKPLYIIINISGVQISRIYFVLIT